METEAFASPQEVLDNSMCDFWGVLCKARRCIQ